MVVSKGGRTSCCRCWSQIGRSTQLWSDLRGSRVAGVQVSMSLAVWAAAAAAGVSSALACEVRHPLRKLQAVSPSEPHTCPIHNTPAVLRHEAPGHLRPPVPEQPRPRRPVLRVERQLAARRGAVCGCVGGTDAAQLHVHPPVQCA